MLGMQSCILGWQCKREGEVCDQLLGNVVCGPCNHMGAAEVLRYGKMLRNVLAPLCRRALWVVGNADTLRGCSAWASFEEHCTEQGCLIAAKSPYADLLARQSRKRRHSDV